MMRQLLTMVAVLGIAASVQAGIATEYTVTNDGHLLDGAVFSTFVDGADVWVESVNSADSFGAVGSNATLTISGAAGTGSAWNGVYTYYDGNGGAAPFVGAGQETGASFGAAGLSADQVAYGSYWGDGAGNKLVFLVQMLDGATAASDGAAVVQGNFGSFNNVYLQAVSGGNPSFAANPTGVGSVSVIPEPGTISLMSLSTVGLFLTRTIRRRKRIGKTLMPIRRTALCDSFLSEQEWRCETAQLEELDAEDGLVLQITASVQNRYAVVSGKYREIEKLFWNRMVRRYETRLERRSVRMERLKKGTVHRLDEFLALIMK
jgi:hypothetical protein